MGVMLLRVSAIKDCACGTPRQARNSRNSPALALDSPVSLFQPMINSLSQAVMPGWSGYGILTLGCIEIFRRIVRNGVSVFRPMENMSCPLEEQSMLLIYGISSPA